MKPTNEDQYKHARDLFRGKWSPDPNDAASCKAVNTLMMDMFNSNKTVDQLAHEVIQGIWGDA